MFVEKEVFRKALKRDNILLSGTRRLAASNAAVLFHSPRVPEGNEGAALFFLSVFQRIPIFTGRNNMPC